MLLLFISLSRLQFVSSTSSLPPLHPGTVSLDPGPRLLSVWFFHPFRLPAFLFWKNFPLLSLLLVCPFPAILRLCRHECLATVSFYFQRMLVSLFASSRVVLWFILRAFLACVFTPLEWSAPVNDFMSWTHLCYFALCIIHLRARAA